MNHRINLTKKDCLVVLGCLIFLLAALGAIGQSGRRRAKETVCLSNLNKWGECFRMYLADNDAYFMDGGGYKWFNGLEGYYKDAKLMLCPEATDIYRYQHPSPGTAQNPFGAWRIVGWSGSPYPWLQKDRAGSYGSNTFIYNKGTSNRWNTVNVRGAENVPMLLDSAHFGARPMDTGVNSDPPEFDGEWGGTNTPPFMNGEWMKAVCINRHSGAMNSVFMDFSARRVGLKELWTLKWSPQYDTCGQWTTCGGVQPNDWPEWMRDLPNY